MLHVINGEHYSGAERVQDLLAARLPELGYDVAFACLKPGRFPQRRQSTGAPIFEAPMRSKWDLRPVVSLVEIIRRHSFNLVHAHTPRSLLLARLAGAVTGTPVVYHVHSPAAADSTRRLHDLTNDWIERACLRGKIHLVAVSNSLAGRMLQQRGLLWRRCRLAGKVTVVPNGVPVSDALRSPAAPDGTWTLGTVALFRPRKGTEVLLEAIAKLRSRGHHVRLRAVGPFETNEYERRLKTLVEKLRLDDAVQWTGFVSDVTSQLQQMDLFVLPSLFGEGMPMVVLEAMAAGVPVAATKVEGTPEAIRDGQDGVLAAPGEADDLAGKIEQVVTGGLEWNGLRASAMERHRTMFSDRSMAAALSRVYDRLLGGDA